MMKNEPSGPGPIPLSRLSGVDPAIIDALHERGIATVEQAYEFIVVRLLNSSRTTEGLPMTPTAREALLKRLEELLPEETRKRPKQPPDPAWTKRYPPGVLPTEERPRGSGDDASSSLDEHEGGDCDETSR